MVAFNSMVGPQAFHFVPMHPLACLVGSCFQPLTPQQLYVFLQGCWQWQLWWGPFMLGCCWSFAPCCRSPTLVDIGALLKAFPYCGFLVVLLTPNFWYYHPKFVLHIVGGPILFLHTFVYRSQGAMFFSSDFGIAQSPYIRLHCPTSFGWGGGQFGNVPLRGKVVDFLNICSVSHTMLNRIQELFMYALLPRMLGRGI